MVTGVTRVHSRCEWREGCRLGSQGCSRVLAWGCNLDVRTGVGLQVAGSPLRSAARAKSPSPTSQMAMKTWLGLGLGLGLG